MTSSKEPRDALLRAAIRYRLRGWSIIPMILKSGTKKPAVKWKEFAGRLPSEDELAALLSRPGVNGVAVILGTISGGLTAIDFDSKKTYRRWVNKHKRLARRLPTARTKRGYHVYCLSDLPKVKTFPGGEYRGAGLVIAPPSIHPSGVPYEWIIPLPNGPLPFVTHSVLLNGLITEKPETTETTEAICSADSVLSVVSDLSVLSVLSGKTGEERIEAIIEMTLPKKGGERNNRILDLARGLKFNCDMGKANFKELRPIIVRWHAKALPNIGTKDFDTSWCEFLHAWGKARHPLGARPVDAAAQRVDMDNLPPAAQAYDSEQVRRLVGLCFELARRNRGRFFLGCRDAARILGIKPKQACLQLRMLRKDRVLKLVKKGRGYRASRYRFRNWKKQCPRE